MKTKCPWHKDKMKTPNSNLSRIVASCSLDGWQDDTFCDKTFVTFIIRPKIEFDCFWTYIYIYNVLDNYNSDLLYHTLVLHDIAHGSSTMKAEEHKLYFELATHTPNTMPSLENIGYIMFSIVKKTNCLKTRFNKMNYIYMIIPFETARCLLIWTVLATHS